MRLQEANLENQGSKISEEHSKEEIKSLLKVYEKLVMLLTNYLNYPNLWSK